MLVISQNESSFYHITCITFPLILLLLVIALNLLLCLIHKLNFIIGMYWKKETQCLIIFVALGICWNIVTTDQGGAFFLLITFPFGCQAILTLQNLFLYYLAISMTIVEKDSISCCLLHGFVLKILFLLGWLSCNGRQPSLSCFSIKKSILAFSKDICAKLSTTNLFFKIISP